MLRNYVEYFVRICSMDQFLCPHFKKQRRRFFPVKLCTVRVNIFLYCKFICKSPFSNVHIPTHV